jgi:Uma2 family endonuclease
MTVIERSRVPQVGEQEEALRPRRWTRAEYYRLGEAGFFEDERVELLDGEIWTLPPQKTPHFSAIEAAADLLGEAFGAGHAVRRQGPMTLDDGTEPEPDVLIVPGSRLNYEDHHPTPPEVRLLVEVSDSTLAKDRGKKAEDYARAGIADYWIVNLVGRQLEIYRDPGLLPDGPGYKSRQVLLEGDTVTPLSAPGGVIAVAGLLPRQSAPPP